MHFAGGFLLILQIAVAVHALRTGRPVFWIFLIIFVPLIGLAAYAIVELAPEYLGGYRAQRTASAFGQAISPGRDYRYWKREVDATATVQNMLRLAEAAMGLGHYDEAIALYRKCLQGIHAEDPAALGGLAHAQFGAGDIAGSRITVEKLRAIPGYTSPITHLLHARILEAQGELDSALHEYESLAGQYPGPEASCRFALLLQRVGKTAQAAEIFAEIKRELDRSPRHVRRLNREWYDLARANAG